MRPVRRLLLVLGAASTLALTLLGQSVRVLGVSGEATAQAPGEAAPRPLKVGDTIVVGTRIVTAEGARVVLTPLPGVKSIVAPSSDVLIERVGDETAAIREATLDLRTGAITSDLQKAEGIALDYRIRTARGVAGARGTTYTVAINAAGIQTVVVSHGLISLALADGRTVELSPGQISITRPDGATKTVARAADLDEAERAEAGEWMAATLEGLAEAAEQGLDLQPDAIANAAAAAESLGLDLDDRTARALERALRALERQREQEEKQAERETRRTLQELLEDKTGDDDAMETDTDDDVVKDERDDDDDDSPVTPDDPLATFLAGLSTDRLAAYSELSGDQRRGFALLPTDALRLLVLDVNNDDFNDFALKLTSSGALHQTVAAIRYVGELPTAQLNGFFRLDPYTQTLLLSRLSDTALKNYALTIDGEGDPRADTFVIFFADLSDAQRTRYLALSDRLQTDLAEINQPALTAFALGADTTPDQISYLVALDSSERATLLALPSGMLDLLFAHPGDDDLLDYVLDQAPSLAVATYYADLSPRLRNRFLDGLTAEQRTLAVEDETFAGLVFDSNEGGWVNSEDVLGHYTALPTERRADYAERPYELRNALAEYDRPGFTAAVLSPDTFGEGLAPTDTQLAHALVALLDLSDEHRALFETLSGGPTYSQLAHAPHPGEWSADAFQRTANTYASLSTTQRTQLIALGAAEATMDRSGTYLEAALADFNSLPEATRTAVAALGWGQDFASYFADEKIRATIAAAADLSITERAAVVQFGLSPAGLATDQDNVRGSPAPVALVNTPAVTTARANLATLADLPATDRALLASLYLGDRLLTPDYRYSGTSGTASYADILADTLTFARALEPAQLLALREMGATHWLIDYAPDAAISYNAAATATTALDLVRAKVADYLLLDSELRRAARDTGIFAQAGFTQDATAADITAALRAYLALSPVARAYLATEGNGLDLLTLYRYGGEESSYRSLEDIDALLSDLDEDLLGTLRDLDAAEALATYAALPSSLSEAKSALRDLLDAVNDLDDVQRFALRELGIVGPGEDRLGIFFADPTGLSRLLDEYADLSGEDRAATRQISFYDGYRVFTGNHFFYAADTGQAFTTYDVSFVASDDLRIGATRRLALSGKHADIGVTFSVPAGKDLHLRASDLIDLDNVSVSAGVRAITMAAVTINLSNFDFPEGSVAALTSRDGVLRFGNDARVGSVNFKSNVTYGGELMFDNASFHSASRNNIAIGSFDDPAQLPSFTPKPTTTGGKND